jgi:hypothetical protein
VMGGQGLAQQSVQPQTLEDSNRKMEADVKKPRPGWLPSMLVPVNQSLTDLLNNGWTISGGGMGIGLMLHRENKWLACEIDDGRMFGAAPTSHCVALN